MDETGPGKLRNNDGEGGRSRTAYLVLLRKLDVNIVVQIDWSFLSRIQDVHNRLLLAHDTVMVSMIRGLKVALAVGAVGSDEAFGISKTRGWVALCDGIDRSRRHF